MSMASMAMARWIVVGGFGDSVTKSICRLFGAEAALAACLELGWPQLDVDTPHFTPRTYP